MTHESQSTKIESFAVHSAVDPIYDFERPLNLIKCPKCERRFATREALGQHMKAKKHGRL